jgi:hypothetical protein
VFASCWSTAAIRKWSTSPSSKRPGKLDFAANAGPIRLANPIASQMAVLRSTLLGGLIANLVTNLRRKQSRVRLFETGRIFRRAAQGLPVAGFHQPWKLAGLAYGGALPEGWGSGARKVDFYDVKGDLEALLAPASLRFEKLGIRRSIRGGRPECCATASTSAASANCIRNGCRSTICPWRRWFSKSISLSRWRHRCSGLRRGLEVPAGDP